MIYREPDDADQGDVHTGTRVCKTCQQRKHMVQFHWANGHKARRRKCKACVHARAMELRAANPEKYRAADRTRSLRAKYGLTPDDYLSLLGQQNNQCGICANELSPTATHVDHDHATGVVRGLLCFLCNTALGKFRDNPDVLRAAISYLERSASSAP